MKKTTILLLGLIVSLIGFSRDEVNFTNDTSYEIPEDTTYHCSSLNISDVGIIDNQYGLKKVCVEIESQDDQDLIFYLQSPDGIKVLLSKYNGEAGNNYGTSDNPTCFTMDATTDISDGAAPFEGQFKPEEDLALFNNFQNANGTWKLCIADVNGENNSNVTLKKWTLTFGENPPNRVIEINTCDSTWFDTGGESGNYGDNEDYWVKIKTDSSKIIKLFFDKWLIADANDDRMTIYDGYKTLENIIAIGDEWNSLIHTTVQMSDTNSLHYLLIHWKSDDSLNEEGWNTSIKCVRKCQKVEYVWDGSIPTDDTNYIAACSNTTITFNAHGVYSDNDHYYHQSDETSLFIWDFGDNATDTGVTVQHVYDEIKNYYVNLTVIDTMECESDLYLDKQVIISIPPTFNLYPEKKYLYLDDKTTILGDVKMHYYSNAQRNETVENNDTLPLLDGSGVYFFSDIMVSGFKSGATITDVSQIDSITLNIEHSYVGDLITWLICPNGTEVVLFDGNDQDAGRSSYLGIPYDEDGNDTPGIGWNYSFKENAPNREFEIAETIDVTSLNGEEGKSIKSGTYEAMSSFSDLVGCPLNGKWTIKIQDDQPGDNGYLFKWNIAFKNVTHNDSITYQMEITDSLWTSLDNSDIDTSVFPVEVYANKLGENRFEYTITDQFGCSHDTIITIIGSDVNFELSKEDVLCYGTNTGKVHLTVTEGTVSKYIWENPDGTTGSEESTVTEKDWENLTIGTFTVTVEDADGYPNVQSTEITEPDVIVITEIHEDAKCYDDNSGTIQVTVSGGTPDYSYSWAGPEGYSSSEEDIDSLKAGSYKLVVSDQNHCKDSITAEIQEPDSISISICVVTVDTATNTNLVIWERGDDRLVKYYNIYRKNTTSEDYLLIDSVNVEALTTYYDTAVNPNERSWEYKMSVVDSCDNESALSESHKTIHLEMTRQMDGSIKLEWNDYEGTDYSLVYIYRKIGDDAWEVLDSLSSDEHTYTNRPLTYKKVQYLVIIKTEASCNVTSRGTRSSTTYTQFISNIVVRAATTAVHNVINTNIQIYPNPTKGQIIVRGEDIVRVEVSTANGQKIRDIKSYSNKLKINLAKEAKGLYFVKVTTKQGVLSQKIVLE